MQIPNKEVFVGKATEHLGQNAKIRRLEKMVKIKVGKWRNGKCMVGRILHNLDFEKCN